MILAVGLLSGVGWLAINTRVGIAARAAVVDPQMAASSGVTVEKIRYGSFRQVLLLQELQELWFLF